MLYLAVLLAIFLAASSGMESPGKCSSSNEDLYLRLVSDMIVKASENAHCPEDKPADCEEWLLKGYRRSGSYKIWPKSRVLDGKSVDVYCDMEVDGGGWTVIQRRGNFSRPEDYFYQGWSSYKAGFGNIEKDFWLGNDKIFALTNQKLSSVRFDLKDVEGNVRYSLYDTFWIDDETQKYTLHIQDYSGNAGDSMIERHNGMRFTTKDNNNGLLPDVQCAEVYKGAWWYGSPHCHKANLNGLHLRGKHSSFADGVNWVEWKGYYESLEASEIKIRSKNFKQRLMVKLECAATPQS